VAWRGVAWGSPPLVAGSPLHLEFCGGRATSASERANNGNGTRPRIYAARSMPSGSLPAEAAFGLRPARSARSAAV
jgi:hypothetical protein